MPTKNTETETKRTIPHESYTLTHIFSTSPIRKALEGAKTTPIPRTITKLEESSTSRQPSEPTCTIKTSRYTEGTTLPSMTTSSLSNTKTVPNACTNVIQDSTTTPTSKPIPTTTPIRFMSSRGSTIATIRFNIPTDTKMWTSYRPTTTLTTNRLLSEIEGAIATLAQLRSIRPCTTRLILSIQCPG